MKRNLKVYPRSFKQEAVRLSYQRGCIEQVEKELGITPSLLNRWRQDYEKFGAGSFCGSGYLKMNPEQQKIHNLKKRIKKAELQSEILKKAVPFLKLGNPAVMAFIENHKEKYSLKMICSVLGISPHTYRKWKNDFISETQQKRNKVKQEITKLFYKAEKRYGCARITVELHKLGYQITSTTTGRYMRELGLYVSVKRES
ncbi:transposase-like protein [Flavobacterium sp. 270]|uniref:transposase n=1 Tax=Flavobacterium sp. 270 TaxID=2512114 RepID=UPI0010650517|nr:transposase [Flavobacterium sp. 270]TDW47846.1 transposase-like protein [Flavobacterium sp. 270]